MRYVNQDDEGEGWTPFPQALEDEGEKSLVLDKNGDPYSYKKRYKVGFNLKRSCE